MRKILGVLCLAGVLSFYGGSCRRNTDDVGVQEEFEVAGCSGQTGESENCYWRYRYEDELCSTTSKCSKLVIFFSGGEMGCDDNFGDESVTATYSTVLRTYAQDGYVAVCAGIFLESDPGGDHAFYSEASRVDKIVLAVTSSSQVTAVWSGEHLLIAGISHGASAPVASMARTSIDANSYFSGTTTTAACFHDGIYDIGALDTFLAGDSTCTSLRDRTVCGRYGGGTSSCGTVSGSDVTNDTITAVAASNYSIPTWKLVECGSGLDKCATLGNWVPEGPIQTLCTQIDNDASHTCEYGSLPSQAHVACHATTTGIAECKDWFNGLVGD